MRKISAFLSVYSAFAISFLCSLGWIYESFPANWWQSVSCFDWLIRALQILFSGVYVGVGAALIAWCVICILGERKSPHFCQRHLTLLLPAMAAMFIPVWGAYCSLQKGTGLYSVNLDAGEPWYVSTLFKLAVVPIVYGILLLSYVLFSKNWIGERALAVGVLTCQLISGFALFFAALFYALRSPI